MNTKVIPAADPSRFHGDKELNEAGQMKGTYELAGGIVCRYTLRQQPATTHYRVRGSVSLLDPATSKTMTMKKRPASSEKQSSSLQPAAMDSPPEQGSSPPPPDPNAEKDAAKRPKATLSINTESADAAALREEVAQKAIILYQDNILLLASAAEKALPVSQMSFPLILAQLKSTYLSKRSGSAEMQHTYELRLEKVSLYAADKAVSKISQNTLSNIQKALGIRWRDYFQEASRFLAFAYHYRLDSEGINVFQIYLDRNPPDNQKNSRLLQLKAGNSDVLSLSEEQTLNREIESNIHNGILIGITLVKEGGLSAQAACDLTWEKVTPMESHPDIQMIEYHRNDVAGATHDYSFPLFPFGSKVLCARKAWLKERFTDEQIAKMPVASAKSDPMTKLLPSQLTEACRNVLRHCGVGYAALAKHQDLQSGAGIHLLHETYRYRLEEICGLRDDPALVKFLMHNVLTNLVQADHYRCFTDASAQHMMATALLRDKRFEKDIPPAKQFKRKKVGPGEQVTVPAPSVKTRNHVKFRLRLKPGEVVKLSSPHGCYVVSVADVSSSVRNPDSYPKVSA